MTPLSGASVVRTDFSDQATWEAIRDTITAETEEGFQAYVDVVDDAAGRYGVFRGF